MFNPLLAEIAVGLALIADVASPNVLTSMQTFADGSIRAKSVPIEPSAAESWAVQPDALVEVLAQSTGEISLRPR